LTRRWLNSNIYCIELPGIDQPVGVKRLKISTVWVRIPLPGPQKSIKNKDFTTFHETSFN
jgi:hypothetical protein